MSTELPITYLICISVISVELLVIIFLSIYLLTPKPPIKTKRNETARPDKKANCSKENFDNYSINTENIDQTRRVVTTIDYRRHLKSGGKERKKLNESKYILSD